MLFPSHFYTVSTLSLKKTFPSFPGLEECASLLWRAAVDAPSASPSAAFTILARKLFLGLIIQSSSWPGNCTSAQCRRIMQKDIFQTENVLVLPSSAFFFFHVLENKRNKQACTHIIFLLQRNRVSHAVLRDEKSERLLDYLAFPETTKSPGRELHRKKPILHFCKPRNLK